MITNFLSLPILQLKIFDLKEVRLIDIIRRIDELCELHHMSKYRLSQITGISQSAFSKMARQQTSLSLETIQRICDAFGITMAQFFSVSDEYPDLTQQQKFLLNYWGMMDRQKQEFILLMMEKLYEINTTGK